MVMTPVCGIAPVAILGAAPGNAQEPTMDTERDRVIPAMDA